MTIEKKKYAGIRCPTKTPFYPPSVSAHYEFGRRDGGGQAAVTSELYSDSTVLADLSLVPALQIPGLSPVEWTRQDILNHTSGTWDERVALPLLVLQDGLEMWPKNPFLTTLRAIGFRAPEEQIGLPNLWLTHWVDAAIESLQVRDALRATWMDNMPHRRPLARVVGIPEPLKIRTITAGPELAYYWAQYIQKNLHSQLRQHPTFRLIGKTLDRVDIHQTFKKFPLPGQFWVSGDYKAATNLISSQLTEVAARTYCEMIGLDEALTGLVVNCLVNHELHVTGVDGKDRVGEQKNGQLMGSPLSFPFLCLINAALTRYSLELRDGCRVLLTLRDLELLINGDDVAFVTDKEGYEIWKLVTGLGGLVASIGKNFTSREFIVINSQMFRVHEKMEIVRGMRSSIRGHRYYQPNHIPCAECGQFHTSQPLPIRMDREMQTDMSAQGLIVDEQDLLNRLGRPFTQQDQHQDGRVMTNVFSDEHWFNPDYLGPAGHFIDVTPPQLGKRMFDTSSLSQIKSLVKKSRFSSPITQLSQIWDPTGYAILPGLQKKWLGNIRGETRHLANQRFLKSWCGVLKTSQFEVGGHTFVPDWFLPTALGGIGLENTDRRGLMCSSEHNRRLANYLCSHPKARPLSMPVLRCPTPLGLHATERILRIPQESKVYLTAHQVRKGVDQDLVPHDVILGAMSRSSLLYHAGMSVELANLSGSYVSDTDLSAEVQAAIKMEQYRQSRRRLFESSTRSKWSKYQPISQQQIDSFEPESLYYRIGVHPAPRVDFDYQPLPPYEADYQVIPPGPVGPRWDVELD
jgi:hypothetical protein